MKSALSSEPLADARESARRAGLHYVSDKGKGIRREQRGEGFVYYRPDGGLLRDKNALLRIRRLAIPPAWTRVWICPDEDGHLQASGRDARGRKQYRYHDDWRMVRDEAKFEHMAAFAQALPRMRRQVGADLRRKDLCREKALATVVGLLEKTLIRVGNDEYTRENGSHGLTTLRNHHARVKGSKVSFHFKGKSGKEHDISISDLKLAKIVRRCQELPGQDLFGYRDAEGKVHDITSDDVNGYIREISGGNFTAKDFRTWAGTVQTAVILKKLGAYASQREAKRNISTAIDSVARQLGNTPAICRKCYVHPGVLTHYLAGRTIELKIKKVHSPGREQFKLAVEECAVMILLS